MMRPPAKTDLPNKAPAPAETIASVDTRSPATREKEMLRRESILTSDEVDMRHREQSVTVREDAAYSREHAAHRREGEATAREADISVAESNQAASDDHMAMLQQTNARLVISTLEAQKLAAELQAAKAALEQAKLVAENASRAKSAFLSSMSHELRTPLNAILGFAQLLESGAPPPSAAQAGKLHEITKAGWYLLELINEILDLSGVESGKLSLSCEPVNINEVMRECEAMVQSQAQARGIQMTFHTCDTAWFANADRTRTKQVLINLLSNAIKYNREHGTVEVMCTRSAPEHIRIYVKDSGAGLAPEKLVHLFEPFNRLGQETGSEEGTGIGLVLTKQLVELMGGRMGVESSVGVGSEFWVELSGDVMPSALAENRLTVAPALPGIAGAAPRYTLLYVEDNPANLMLVEQIIEAYPEVRMLSARDGAQGVALARAHLPDMILMDINLPGISGIEALKILQADTLTAHIPILALSANAMPSDIDKCLRLGFFRYLTKPIVVHEFVNALDEVFKSIALRNGSQPQRVTLTPLDPAGSRRPT